MCAYSSNKLGGYPLREIAGHLGRDPVATCQALKKVEQSLRGDKNFEGVMTAEVDIKLTNDFIEVKDNGTGMDREGLQQYFNIGSPEKILKSKSPIFHRDRIGQFGIGKFANLSACECFEISTQKGDFAAKVIFDKMEWEKDGDQWFLPLKILSPDNGCLHRKISSLNWSS